MGDCISTEEEIDVFVGDVRKGDKIGLEYSKTVISVYRDGQHYEILAKYNQGWTTGNKVLSVYSAGERIRVKRPKGYSSRL